MATESLAVNDLLVQAAQLKLRNHPRPQPSMLVDVLYVTFCAVTFLGSGFQTADMLGLHANSPLQAAALIVCVLIGGYSSLITTLFGVKLCFWLAAGKH